MDASADGPLEYELQRELSGVMIQGYMGGLRREFETRLCDNQNHIVTLTKSWKDDLSEITALRDELTGIVAAASEHPHSGLDRADDMNSLSMKDETELDIPDFSLLKHMRGDEITAFLRSEWLKLRREHESELHKKTEELFRLKRDFAKDGAFLPFRKERQLELIKSKLLQTISKMDGMIATKDGSNCFDYDADGELCRLKGRIGSLLDENERLRGLLADKRKEAQQLSSQVTRHSLSESKLSKQVEKLGDQLDDLKTESQLKDLLELTVLREIFGDYEIQIDDGDQEECLLRELIMEKDELTMFREKVCEQELLILEFKSESNSMKSCLYEALQQIHVCKQEICGLTESLTSTSVALEQAKEQNASLDATIREMKTTSASCIDSHGGHLEFDLVSMEKLSNAYSDFESRIAQSMKQSEIRLTSIMRQFNPLMQQVSVLKKKEFWYKQILEIKCSNLRKAEAEVDILGDEVDTLLNVLGKIYIALDHYSPVWKHYPGVTEILNLVQKVLKGESV